MDLLRGCIFFWRLAFEPPIYLCKPTITVMRRSQVLELLSFDNYGPGAATRDVPALVFGES